MKTYFDAKFLQICAASSGCLRSCFWREIKLLFKRRCRAHVMDKSMPTAGLLAQALIVKYQDHLPLYRQEGVFNRAAFDTPRLTLAQ